MEPRYANERIYPASLAAVQSRPTMTYSHPPPTALGLAVFLILLFTYLPKGGAEVVAQRNVIGRDARRRSFDSCRYRKARVEAAQKRQLHEQLVENCEALNTM